MGERNIYDNGACRCTVDGKKKGGGVAFGYYVKGACKDVRG